MSPQRTIRLRFALCDPADIHRIRNLGEDLYRQIERTELGDIGGLDTVDRATDSLVVHIPHARHVRRMQRMVEDLVREHGLRDMATLRTEP